MSTISASTTSTTAYKVTADTTGTLVFQTGATPTTAMTLGTDQSVTFAGTQTYTGAATFTSGITVQGLTVGKGAGAVATNTAVGASALSGGSLSGARNIGIGQNAGNTLTTGAQNTFVGSYCGTGITTGTQNIGIGDGAMTGNSSNATGSYNVGVGALTALTSGSNNVGVGYQALNANTTASNNTAVGYQAGYSNTTNGANAFFGGLSGYNSTGVTNTYLGYGAGYSMTSGGKNVIIGGYNGNQGGLDIRTSSNCIVLSDGDGNVRVLIYGTGYFTTGTGANSPYNNASGSGANMVVGSDGALFRSTSSLKYKTDVQDANFGIADVLKLRAVTYKGKGLFDGDKVFAGLIAEEVHEAGLTQFVQYADDGSPDALSYGNMVSLCIKAIQELKAELDTAKLQIAALQGASA